MSHPYQDVFYETIENLLTKVKEDCEDLTPLKEENTPHLIIENLEDYFKDILVRVNNIKNKYKL